MSTIADKLRTILGIKTEIKQAIIDKGGTLDDTTPFAEYPEKILEIQGGGGSSDITPNDILRQILLYN